MSSKPVKLITAMLLMLCLQMAQAATDMSSKRVLLIFSYHPSFPTSDKVIRGIKNAFGEHMPVIDIDYMDSKRLYDLRSQKNYLSTLSHKLSNRKPYDVVMTADDNALDFALEHRNALFPNASVVFLGVNNITKAMSLEDVSGVTGVVEAASFKETIELAQQLMPKRKKVHLVVDASKTGQTDLATIYAMAADLPRVELSEIALNQLTWTGFEERVALLGGDDIVLLLSAFRDRNNAEKSFEESLSLLVDNTRVPILHTWEHGIGEGILGGITVSHFEQGRQAGLMAKQILQGGNVDDIGILDKSPNIPTFDYRVMDRFLITHGDLPLNSIVLFKTYPVWEQYRYELSLIAAMFVLLVFTALYLAKKNFQMKKLSGELIEKSRFLRLLMDTLPDLVWIKNRDGVFLTCNKRFEDLAGMPERNIAGKTDFDLVSKEQARFFRLKDREVIQSGSTSIFETTLKFNNSDKEEVIETIKTPVFDANSRELLGVLGVGRDISERKAAEGSLRLAASVFENTVEGVLITDASANIVEVNKAFTEITGYCREEIVGQKPRLLQSGEQDLQFYKSLWDSLSSQGYWSGEIINRKKDGTLFPLWETISVVRDDLGQVTHYVAVFSDITELKESQEKIEHLAYHDSLTHLPNRFLFKEHLDQTIKRDARHNRSFALMYLDLDNFKYINDSFGHPEGDELLKHVATTLRNFIRADDFVARIGGDEFVILLDEMSSSDKVKEIAEELLNELLKSIPLKHHEVNISASIGICMYPEDGRTTEDLMRHADAAMYRAKRAGRNAFHFYTQDITKSVKERVQIESLLRKAIQDEEFQLYYQPQIDFSTGQIEGAEALVRWFQPNEGMIPPDKFIPVAEESGLILPLGEWVLDAAVRQAKAWLEQEIEFGKIAVNVSGLQIQKDNLTELVQQTLAKHELESKYLALEVTETFIMQHANYAISQLQQLENMGVEIAIDDFGTGYSSLSYLKELPINKLKIDRSFIDGIPDDKNDLAISKTIIALGKSLDFKITAEGVETVEQADFLRMQGCNEAQGYLYSRPLPAKEFEAYIDQNQQFIDSSES